MQYLVSYLVSRLMIGRSIILEQKLLWKKGLMDNTFLQFLNITLPCDEECPVDYGEPRSCHLNKEKRQLQIEFVVPTVNKNLTILEADPFDLMVRENGKTCRIVYDGPKNAMLSNQEDCLYATDMGKDPKGRVLMAHNLQCIRDSSLDEKEAFKMDKCQPSKEGDEVDFVQIKAHGDNFHIYCPGMKYILGDKREVYCPNKVFTLPITATFTLNDVTYRGSILSLVYREQEDPLLNEQIHWHLTPLVNWENLNKTFPILKAMDGNHWKKDDNVGLTTTTIILGFGLGLLIAWILWRKFKRPAVMSKRPVMPLPKKKEQTAQPKEQSEQPEQIVEVADEDSDGVYQHLG